MTVLEKLQSPAKVALLIDHTLLKPEASKVEIGKLCEEARQFGFATVCINPYWVRLAKEALQGSLVKVCTVVGFPLGANETESKLAEARLSLSQGAAELDMVQNIGALRSGDTRFVSGEIAALAKTAHEGGALLKVILETCLLDAEQKRVSCLVAAEAGADFVKTSTGFSLAGAKAQDVALMRQAVGSTLGVKASGGVRTLGALREMVEAGANRIGTSSGVLILREIEAAAATVEH